MGVFKIDGSKSFFSCFFSKERNDMRKVVGIFYEVFPFCKIIFVPISDIIIVRQLRHVWHVEHLCRRWSYLYYIFPIICFQCSHSSLDRVEEVTRLQCDIPCEPEARESQSDYPHTSESSWSDDAPYFSYSIFIQKSDDNFWKLTKIISLWKWDLCDYFRTIEDEYFDIFRYRIDKEFHRKSIWKIILLSRLFVYFKYCTFLSSRCILGSRFPRLDSGIKPEWQNMVI